MLFRSPDEIPRTPERFLSYIQGQIKQTPRAVPVSGEPKNLLLRHRITANNAV